MNILIAHISDFSLWNAPEWLGHRLHQTFPQHRIKQLRDYRDLDSAISDAEVLVGSSLTADQFANGTHIRWIHSPAAAVHQLLLPALIESDVLLTNASSVHGPVVAEHALALMFCLAKGLRRAFEYQSQHVWAKQQMWQNGGAQRPAELAGKTLLVVGMGHIGSHLTRLSRAIGMHVIGVRAHPERGGEADEVFGPDALDPLFERADYIVLAAPVTADSERRFGKDAFAAMRSSAYLINVSRGDLIDEEALVHALCTSQIAGAALDVFQEEPLPSYSPLWTVQNLVMTPHTAGFTDRMWERHYDLIADNIRRYDAGSPLTGLVSKRLGY